MRPTSSQPETDVQFSIWRSLKLGSFHIGSSLTDLLTSAVWNRILIVDLGIVAWPVALLTALRYFLAPLTLWAGHRSDTRPILGSHRVAYIWLGRLLMLLSLPLLPLSTVAIARAAGSPLGWGLALLSFSLYGVGTLISGAPFLALVHDSAPYERRGQAMSIVQVMLVVSFAFIPALYAIVMPVYSDTAFTRLVMIGMAGAAIFWFFSVRGEERDSTTRTASPEISVETERGPMPSFRTTFDRIWAQEATRRYAVFLGASAFFAFMQDAVLEPFGGDVFGLAAGETTRFNAYWGIGVLLGMLGTIVATRHWRPHQQARTTAWGLVLLGTSLVLLGTTSFLENQAWILPVLVVFGLGFGIFTVGGVSLLMAMSTEERAGSYMALWSVIQLVTRGAGIASGGLIRDIALALSNQFNTAYGILFVIEALGLYGCIYLLRQVDITGFARHRTPPSPVEMLAATSE